MKKTKNGGFTLMEMLIVVGIIAVLVLIAIPTFSASLRKAREAACLANRRALYAEATMNYLLDETIHGEALSAEEAETYKCPSKGTLTVSFDTKANSFNVRCSEHGYLFKQYDVAADAIKDALQNVSTALEEKGLLLWNGNRKRVDSSGNFDGAITLLVKEEFKKLGVDMDALGAKTWTIINSEKDGGVDIIWSSYATDDKVYKTVPAICLKPDGSYTVGLTNVNATTASGVSGTYDVIAKNAEKNGFNPTGATNFATYDEALAHYNTLAPIKGK